MQNAPGIKKPRIIPAFPEPWEPDAWRQSLARALRSARDLREALALPADDDVAGGDFPVRVPPGYLRRIRRGDPSDPLLLQVMPDARERVELPGYIDDALGERSAERAPTLLQKYRGRALLITTPACAVHCRYCFRQHFPYAEHRPSEHDQAVAEIAGDATIEEVILSGGDPLTMPDAPLARLLEQLDEARHVKRLRLHSRVPVVLPERTTQALLDTLAGRRAHVVLVVHVNHAQELDADTHRALALLRAAGITLLNQAVLLRNVNDTWEAQRDLSEALFEQGVLPYYLHMPDQVRGTHHFDVDDSAAKRLMTQLHAELPGYLVPRLVREVPGQSGKSPIYWTTEAAKSL